MNKMNEFSIAVIVPCYNEYDRLPLDDFLAFGKNHPEFFFLFVDDGSTDGTGSLIKPHCNRQIQLLTLPTNSGKAEAVRQGILNALEKGFPKIAFWDADLATPLDEIFGFIKKMDQDGSWDMVIGSRIHRLGAHIKRNVWRHLIGRALMTVILYFIVDFSVYDSQCGAKVMTAEAAREIMNKPFITRWLFDLEMLVRLKHFRKTNLEDCVYEYPLSRWQEIGASKVRVFTVLKDVIRFNRYYRR